MTMLEQFKRGKPGHRFQSVYESQQKSRRPAWIRPVSLAAGAVVIAAGIVALPAPGPGFLVIGLGGTLMARESLVAARILDWIELRLRETWAWLRKAWGRASRPVKALIVLIGAISAVAVGWLAVVYILNRR
jgi:uncharacterized protein (TIGR02611 family)